MTSDGARRNNPMKSRHNEDVLTYNLSVVYHWPAVYFLSFFIVYMDGISSRYGRKLYTF